MSAIPFPNIAALGGEVAAAPEQGIAEAARTRALNEQATGQGLQNQVLTQQLRDQQAMTAALHEWDGKDITQLPGLVIKHGASANAVLGLKNSIVDQQTKLANLSKDQLANTQTQHTQIADAISPLTDPKAVADADLAAQIHQVGQGLLQSGTLDPQHEQEIERLSQLAQTDPNAARQQLDMHRKAYTGQATLAEMAKNQGQGQEATAKAGEAEANTAKTQAEMEFYKNQGLAPGVTPEMAEYASYIKGGGDPKQYAGWKAKQVSQAEAPVRIATAQAEGAARANIEAQMARGSNAALANVPPHLVAPATAAASKAGEDYAQAKSVSDRLSAMMDAAKKGNVVSYQLIPQEGALQVTTSQGVHRINMAEIQNYGGGSLWQRLQGHIGKQLTGKSIPESVLNDMKEMQEVQAKGSREQYNNKLKTINQSYGSEFKPVEMDNFNTPGSLGSADPFAAFGGKAR